MSCRRIEITKTHEQIKISVAYPPLKGCILKTYHLQRHLGASFDAVIELEERIGEQLSVSLNETVIYVQTIDENLDVDTEGIIKALCECSLALKKAPEIEAEAEPDNDPEYRQWFNSVCSGE